MKKIFISLILIFSFLLSFSQQKVTKEYYPSHKVKSIQYFTSGRLEKVILFYENGNKKKESHFNKSGKLFGLQIEYYENGLKKEELYILGVDTIPLSIIEDTSSPLDNQVDVLTCKKTTFNSKGGKHSEGYIVNGLRVGYWLFYDDNGTFSKYEFYKYLSKDE